MAIEMSVSATTCYKCGREYGKHKGLFPVSYAAMYKGVGYIPICKNCIDTMYKKYLSECNDTKVVVRQMCRKLDLYWDEHVYEFVSRRNPERSIMIQYISKINNISYAGKSYDDTLIEEGTLWNFSQQSEEADKTEKNSIDNSIEDAKESEKPTKEPEENIEDSEFNRYVNELMSYPVTKEVIAFWGTGYTKQMYAELEQRRAYWMSRFSKDIELDAGTEALIRQICSLELDINRDRAEGKSVEKSTNALNNLLGSANLKPVQKKEANDDFAKQPLGVKLYHREKFKPLPELEESEKDRRHIKKYIWTWMGHICKMCGMKNGYTKLYDEAIKRLRVEMPQYADESDEDLIIHSFDESSEND